MKQSLEKCLTVEQGYTAQPPDLVRATTRYIVRDSSKSMGF
jgi:hypothetical protein